MSPAMLKPSTAVAGSIDSPPCDIAATGERRVSRVALRRRIAPCANAFGAVTGALIVLFAMHAGPPNVAALTFALFLLAGVASSRRPRSSALLPLTHAALAALCQAGAALAVWLVLDATAAGPPQLPALALAALAAGAAAALARRQAAPAPTRIAVVGDGRSAERLRCDLLTAGVDDHSVVGIVFAGGDGKAPAAGPVPVLGTIATLAQILQRHAVDVLLISGEASRTEVFDKLADTCLGSAVRICDVTQLYEDVLGHVPVGEIGSAWFRYVMHPRFRSPDTTAKRALDLSVALAAGVVFLPVVALCALLIKLEDGGPVLFRQRRIGNHGSEFTLLKLRTMRTSSDVARWSCKDDDRVTRVGRLLRRTHLDEMPQLANVLRGEMSVVGPRPEQPAFVEHLEQTLPHYSRRHLIKPGLTGWAQVRCGYAASDAESEWKLCHDLYYLKHQSIRLDIAILVETARTLVADRQYRGQDVTPAAVVAPLPGMPAVVAMTSAPAVAAEPVVASKPAVAAKPVVASGPPPCRSQFGDRARQRGRRGRGRPGAVAARCLTGCCTHSREARGDEPGGSRPARARVVRRALRRPWRSAARGSLLRDQRGE